MSSVLIPADIRFPLERANGVQTVKTAAALARAGTRVRLLVRQSDPRPTEEILPLFGLTPDPRLVVDRVRVFHRPGAFALPRALFLARATVAAHRCVRREGLVFTRDLQLAEWLLRTGARPVVYEAHAVEHVMYRERGALYGTAETPDPRKTERLKQREAFVWRQASAVVTTTRGIAEAFTEAFGDRPAVRTVANGADLSEDRVFPELPQGEPRVLYAGQLYPWKGVDVLVEALVSVPAARLVLLGGLEGEKDLARVRELVARRWLQNRVEMRGTVPQAEVARELSRAHLVAVPFLLSQMTESHTSPIKVFEAMAAGRPIVASDAPSTREILKDGESARLVPPGDAQALAAAIRSLLEDRALAERLARNAFAAAPGYSWDARAAALRQLFSEFR